VTKLNGGHLIAQYLVEERVPYVFGVSGHGNVGLLNVLYDYRDQIKAVSVHHEQVAGHMADAYFRVAHRPVMTFTSTGPGTLNLPMSLATALMDSSAFLALTANVATSQYNRGPFQELNRHYQAESSHALRPFVKKAFNPTRIEMLPIALRQAFKAMLTGRPGPVQVDVPFNLFLEEGDVEVPEADGWRRNVSNRIGASRQDISRILDMLVRAERPLILAGHGVVLSEGAAALRDVAEALDIPVVHSPNAKGVVDSRSRFALGGIGRNGSYPANEAAKQCDVLLTVGCRFDDRMTSSWLPGYTFEIPPTRLIHVDIDPDEIGRNFPVVLGIPADAKTVLEQLLDAVRREEVQVSNNASWWDQIAGWQSEWQAHLKPLRESEATPVRPERLMAEMRKVIPDDAILLPDSGTHHNWMVQMWDANQPGTLLQTVGFASMGFGVCGVLGAKLAAPERTCIAVVGDGGMMMTPQAIPTAVEYNIPVVWLVWNNHAYGAIRDLQLSVWDREYTTSFCNQDTGELYHADLPGLAKSFGAGGARVERPGEIGDVIRTAIDENRPYLVEIVIDREAKAPAVASWHLPPLPPARPNFPV
jgi:acetolactate synthase-1/2/3 large subunit